MVPLNYLAHTWSFIVQNFYFSSVYLWNMDNIGKIIKKKFILSVILVENRRW